MEDEGTDVVATGSLWECWYANGCNLTAQTQDFPIYTTYISSPTKFAMNLFVLFRTHKTGHQCLELFSYAKQTSQKVCDKLEVVVSTCLTAALLSNIFLPITLSCTTKGSKTNTWPTNMTVTGLLLDML